MASADNNNPHIFYLVRHGESVGNANKVFMDPNTDALTEQGELQVELLGKYLARENITRVFSSDFLRAYKTAEAIVKSSKNSEKLVIKTDHRLRERTVGVFQGKKYQDAILALKKHGGDILSFTPHGAEKLKDVGLRMYYFFKEICDELDKSEEEQEVVVIVSHSFALIQLMDNLVKSKRYRIFGWDQLNGLKMIRNASFIKLSVGVARDNCEDLSTLPGQRRINFLNMHETEHLKGLLEKDTLVKYTHALDEAKSFSGCIQS